ncbi:hypothetical protein [Paenibacillus soyae]|uniref:Uncharacterized protein n=1 Tax=Paenibacillus soyae TaxID=2969249 RepID=A0A9X2MVC5_9BACL|nr:hypothetical protein [Paenibacillus soyae]MCR2806536.1 hypothetical protein [Paenibacillus soyae]
MAKIQHFSKVSLNVLLAVVLLMVPQLAAAAGEQTAAKTAPPPLEMKPMASYTGYTYLKSSSINVQSNANQSITILATTDAHAAVQEVGVTIQLQEWTGSSWINLVPIANNVEYGADYASGTLTRSSKAGYYYRAKVTHYAKQGTTTESVVEYSASFLAK